MNRRSFLAAAAAAATVPVFGAPKHIDKSRVSAISDEVARSPADAIEFAHKFGIQYLSLREIPAPLTDKKKYSYHALEPDALKAAAKEFKDAGIKIGFLDAPFLKFGLPGTEPRRKEDPARREARIAREQKQFDARIPDLQLGIRAAHAFDCSLVRIFTFTRVAEPESIFPRIADVIGELATVADKEGIKLLIENEGSQNAGTAAETAKLMKLLPANVGINWDTLNGVPLGEKSFPDGYDTLPKDRVWNVHAKGKSLLDYPDHLDWPAILTALERDGFAGRLELETHIFGEGQVQASHDSMAEIIRILDSRK
jgi:sugar phosphate isomerase/epimerase